MRRSIKYVAGAVLVAAADHFLLQQRDDKPHIDNPGMIGLFGGHQEPGETSLECVQREVLEETGHDAPADAFEYLGQCELVTARLHKQATLYLIQGIPEPELNITEGALISIPPAEIVHFWLRMTPATVFAVRVALERLFIMQKERN